jgi:hypothetical protein
VLHGDIADVIAARYSAELGSEVIKVEPPVLALAGKLQIKGEQPLVDAAITTFYGAQLLAHEYVVSECSVSCSTSGQNPTNIIVSLATTQEPRVAAEEAELAVEARTAALSGAGVSLDDDFTEASGADLMESQMGVAAEAGVNGTTFDDPAAAEELQLQQALEIQEFLQEDYELLNAETSSAEQQYEVLTERNQLLQRRLATYFNIRQSGDDGQSRSGDSELGVQHSAAQSQEAAQRYRETLEVLAAKRAAHADLRDRQQQESLALQKRIELRKVEAIQISNSLAQWKRTVAQGSVNSITGRPMTKADIQQFQDEEAVRDADVERARVKNIKLKAALDEHSEQLAAKEHLADGLALIDFEQLKIENSTLNEKIEDRNEELHKLRKKTTTTVQVLTHVKEKLQFVAGEAAELKHQLQQLEQQVAGLRDTMTSLKAARETQRSSIEAKKTEQGFAHNDMLAKDFERRKRDMRQLHAQLEELKAQHTSMTQVVATAKSRGLVDTVLR